MRVGRNLSYWYSGNPFWSSAKGTRDYSCDGNAKKCSCDKSESEEGREFMMTFDNVEQLLDYFSKESSQSKPQTSKERGLRIKRVHFNNPATIILWSDGTKTVVKCQPGDTYDKEKGFAIAYLKKLLGNDNTFNKEMHRWVPEDEPAEECKVKGCLDFSVVCTNNDYELGTFVKGKVYHVQNGWILNEYGTLCGAGVYTSVEVLNDLWFSDGIKFASVDTFDY